MMHNKWDLGDAVRVTRNVRNDGTYPGEETGALLIRRGSVGNVVDVGTFLQDQIIYSVHFLDVGRIVGCREEELLGGDEPWVPSAYEFRQKVRAAKTLASQGETLVEAGAIGQILKVLRDAPGGVAYHVHFDSLPGRPLVVSEGALAPLVPPTAYHDD
jgi:nitrogen fixation protein NifZ